MNLSVVIPAFNEEPSIGRTIASVFEHVPPDQLAEVFVADHGSSDRTVDIARDAGATVEVWNDGTIGAQRNRGAARTTGDVLVFLDADTTLTAEWAERLPEVLTALRADPTTVTGSLVQPPDPPSFLERHWFANLTLEENVTSIGSAHLILTREHFDHIGGFDETLETGEDFELCVRATANGSGIVNDTALRAVHHDFPKSIRAFVRREAWHGRGGFQSWAMVRSSPVALGTALFVGLHAAVPVAAAVRPKLALIPAAGIAGLCVASSLYKFRRAPTASIVVNSGVFYLYYAGRSVALLGALRG